MFGNTNIASFNPTLGMLDSNSINSFFTSADASRFVDIFLLLFNIFNAFVLFCHLHPADSPMKEPIIRAKYYIVSKAHSTPFFVASHLAALIAITTCSTIKYSVTSDKAMLIRAIVAAYTFACTCIFVKLSNIMLKTSMTRVLELEKEVIRHDIVKFQPPSKAIMEAVVSPYKPFITVESIGLDRIPTGPHFYVSNHSLYGLEMPLLINTLYQKKDVFVRGLADHFHFATPNGPILRSMGAVDGTRENVDALMEAGHDVLVYPGGGHEVLKKSSVPRYELMWKERLGFARCAIKHGYPILPCACVGTEDMFSSIGDIPTGYRGMVIPISVTNPCRVQKVYFWFGEPIPTKQYDGDFKNDAFAREVRDRTKQAVEAGIRELQEKQRNDPERYLVDQYASKICQYFGRTVSQDSEDPLEEKVEEENAGATEKIKCK